MLEKLLQKAQSFLVGRPTYATSEGVDTIYRHEPSFADPVSQLCTQAQFASPDYEKWCVAMKEAPRFHRKQWEFCWILQALDKSKMLSSSHRGLGFGVGREPLAATMAALGCRIVATDIDPEHAAVLGWTSTGQYAVEHQQLNDRGICSPERFASHVSYCNVDMNRIPSHLTGFDFTWSSCALEHLGSIEKGIEFIHNSLRCLRPGGVAAHTTEYNVISDSETIEQGSTVLFRRRDIESLVRDLREEGHIVELNLNPGSGELDRYVDTLPYTGDRHLKLRLEGFVTTSIGLLITGAAK